MKLFHGVSVVCGSLALVLSSVALYRVNTHAAMADNADRALPREVGPLTPSLAAIPQTPVAMPAAASHVPVTAPAPAPAAAAVPVPAAAAVPAPVHIAAPGEITVRRLVLARGVDHRTPVEPGTSFTSGDERIYAFLEVDNRSGDSTGLVVTFVPETGHGRVGLVQLDVPAEHHWRTWAFTRGVRTPGLWTAVVRTLDGREVARAPFEVTG